MQSKSISILHKGSQKKIWDYLSQLQRRSNCIIAGFARVRLGWRKHLYMVQFAGDPQAINNLNVLMGVKPNEQAQTPQQGAEQQGKQPAQNRKARRATAKKASKKKK